MLLVALPRFNIIWIDGVRARLISIKFDSRQQCCRLWWSKLKHKTFAHRQTTDAHKHRSSEGHKGANVLLFVLMPPPPRQTSTLCVYVIVEGEYKKSISARRQWPPPPPPIERCVFVLAQILALDQMIASNNSNDQIVEDLISFDLIRSVSIRWSS